MKLIRIACAAIAVGLLGASPALSFNNPLAIPPPIYSSITFVARANMRRGRRRAAKNLPMV
jgi:hypothetical protein